ncbi:MAG: Uma2 family endonuclease [Bryobacterales bacterium]|nr:Uma2 family endonuclease [Bryobacterales bacterium]
MASIPVTRLTEEQYLAIERSAETRSEYFAGEMFAMSGGSAKHTMLRTALVYWLYGHLKATCTVFDSDMRVRVAPSGLYTYPDVSVVCGEPRFLDATQDTLLNPVVIIEVLSPSTESYDRGKKFKLYREIPSLREYVLVAQDAMSVEVFAKDEQGRWVLTEYSKPEEVFRIASVDFAMPLAELYARVELPDTGQQ